MRELDLMKNEIISVAAHQLRSPLSGIKWMIKMLLSDDLGKLTTEQHNWLLRGYESNERLIRTVNDLLEIDRLESGRIKYAFALADLNQLIEKAISELLPKATSKNVHISFEKNNDIPKLYIDAERIEDMLSNLIDNAIKYSKLNSVVKITDNITNDFIRISITDSGIGIPEKDQKNIFSKFFRAQNASSFYTEGTGLGLSIAENVALRHGGKISFTSKENEGTTFYVDLPLKLKALDK
jgi:signal transduction histidine kinase